MLVLSQSFVVEPYVLWGSIVCSDDLRVSPTAPPAEIRLIENSDAGDPTPRQIVSDRKPMNPSSDYDYVIMVFEFMPLPHFLLFRGT
jgi:hypothetical protein